ncbi:MAG: nuclear transport factor 2 family protein [Chthoniobacterales bacterium]
MKMLLLVTIGGLAVGFAVPSAAQEKDTVDPEIRHQIEAVLKQHEEAYNKYDAAGFAAGFTEYAVELSSGGIARGVQEIEEKYAAELAAHPSKQVFKLIQVCAVGDAVCAISEFFHLNTQTNGHYAAIYVRDGNTWIRVAYAN